MMGWLHPGSTGQNGEGLIIAVDALCCTQRVVDVRVIVDGAGCAGEYFGTDDFRADIGAKKLHPGGGPRNLECLIAGADVAAVGDTVTGLLVPLPRLLISFMLG